MFAPDRLYRPIDQVFGAKPPNSWSRRLGIVVPNIHNLMQKAGADSGMTSVSLVTSTLKGARLRWPLWYGACRTKIELTHK